MNHPDADTLRPALDVFRPLLDERDGDISIVSHISIVAAAEARIRARLETPNGEIDLS